MLAVLAALRAIVKDQMELETPGGPRGLGRPGYSSLTLPASVGRRSRGAGSRAACFRWSAGFMYLTMFDIGGKVFGHESCGIGGQNGKGGPGWTASAQCN